MQMAHKDKRPKALPGPFRRARLLADNIIINRPPPDDSIIVHRTTVNFADCAMPCLPEQL
jgi:hypothetical protein